MKVYFMEQGSDAWKQARLGIVTASNAHRIVTAKKCELSKTAVDYALRLCAERLLNATSESTIENPWMERGKDLEPLAVKAYEWFLGVETVPVGFITTDDGLIGCSPDRLVASDERWAVEIKCPSPHVHLRYQLIAGGLGEAIGLGDAIDDYKPQIQTQILVANLHRAHLWSFHERCPPAMVETRPDPDYQVKLGDALKRFNANLDEMHRRALTLGMFQPMPRVVAPVEAVEMADLARRFKQESAMRMQKEGFTA